MVATSDPKNNRSHVKDMMTERVGTKLINCHYIHRKRDKCQAHDKANCSPNTVARWHGFVAASFSTTGFTALPIGLTQHGVGFAISLGNTRP